MFSNQSVSVHELGPGPQPRPQGVRPFALYAFVNESSCAHVFGILKWYFLKESGLYQMTLFEFAFTASP